jgi:acetyl esterase/lipase
MAEATARNAASGAGEPSAAMRAVMKLEAELRAPYPEPKDLPEERALRARICGYWCDGAPEPYRTHELSAPGKAGPVRMRAYRATPNDNAPVILQIHGGGWVFGSIEETEPLSRHLAAATGAVVVSTSYRLAPEHKFPAGLDDCEAALNWILAKVTEIGGDPKRIAVSGGSAGANLAAALALRHPERFKAALLFYGVLGNDFGTPSYVQFGDGTYGLSAPRMQMFFNHYLGAGESGNNPLVTPMLGDLAKLPPAWLCAAECDVLRDDSVRFHEKLKALRSGDQFVLAEGCTHGFINRFRHLPAAHDITKSAAAFFKAKV